MDPTMLSCLIQGKKIFLIYNDLIIKNSDSNNSTYFTNYNSGLYYFLFFIGLIILWLVN